MTQQVFKAIGVLLMYPDATQRELLPAVAQVVASEISLQPETRIGLLELCDALASDSLPILQERYVNIFDRTRSLSLHLYEHLYGDSRDRGQAMVDLSARYAEHGWTLSRSELPDYVPALCEFLSLIELEAAQGLIQDAAPLLGGLHQRLQKRAEDYAHTLAALLELADAAVSSREDSASVEPDSLQQLDSQWEDAPVTFGVGAAHDSCRPNHSGASSSYQANAAEQLVQLRTTSTP